MTEEGFVLPNVRPAVPRLHDKCEFCPKPATHCYREGRGTGHSEHVCACEDHTEDADFGPLGGQLFL